MLQLTKLSSSPQTVSELVVHSEIHEVCASYSGLTITSMLRLLERCDIRHHVRSLDISYNGLGNLALQALIFLPCPQLEMLNLRGNFVDQESVTYSKLLMLYPNVKIHLDDSQDTIEKPQCDDGFIGFGLYTVDSCKMCPFCASIYAKVARADPQTTTQAQIEFQNDKTVQLNNEVTQLGQQLVYEDVAAPKRLSVFQDIDYSDETGIDALTADQLLRGPTKRAVDQVAQDVERLAEKLPILFMPLNLPAISDCEEIQEQESSTRELHVTNNVDACVQTQGRETFTVSPQARRMGSQNLRTQPSNSDFNLDERQKYMNEVAVQLESEVFESGRRSFSTSDIMCDPSILSIQNRLNGPHVELNEAVSVQDDITIQIQDSVSRAESILTQQEPESGVCHTVVRVSSGDAMGEGSGEEDIQQLLRECDEAEKKARHAMAIYPELYNKYGTPVALQPHESPKISNFVRSQHLSCDSPRQSVQFRPQGVVAQSQSGFKDNVDPSLEHDTKDEECQTEMEPQDDQPYMQEYFQWKLEQSKLRESLHRTSVEKQSQSEQSDNAPLNPNALQYVPQSQEQAQTSQNSVQKEDIYYSQAEQGEQAPLAEQDAKKCEQPILLIQDLAVDAQKQEQVPQESRGVSEHKKPSHVQISTAVDVLTENNNQMQANNETTPQNMNWQKQLLDKFLGSTQEDMRPLGDSQLEDSHRPAKLTKKPTSPQKMEENQGEQPAYELEYFQWKLEQSIQRASSQKKVMQSQLSSDTLEDMAELGQSQSLRQLSTKEILHPDAFDPTFQTRLQMQMELRSRTHDEQEAASRQVAQRLEDAKRSLSAHIVPEVRPKMDYQRELLESRLRVDALTTQEKFAQKIVAVDAEPEKHDKQKLEPQPKPAAPKPELQLCFAEESSHDSLSTKHTPWREQIQQRLVNLEQREQPSLQTHLTKIEALEQMVPDLQQRQPHAEVSVLKQEKIESSSSSSDADARFAELLRRHAMAKELRLQQERIDAVSRETQRMREENEALERQLQEREDLMKQQERERIKRMEQQQQEEELLKQLLEKSKAQADAVEREQREQQRSELEKRAKIEIELQKEPIIVAIEPTQPQPQLSLKDLLSSKYDALLTHLDDEQHVKNKAQISTALEQSQAQIDNLNEQLLAANRQYTAVQASSEQEDSDHERLQELLNLKQRRAQAADNEADDIAKTQAEAEILYNTRAITIRQRPTKLQDIEQQDLYNIQSQQRPRQKARTSTLSILDKYAAEVRSKKNTFVYDSTLPAVSFDTQDVQLRANAATLVRLKRRMVEKYLQ